MGVGWSRAARGDGPDGTVQPETIGETRPSPLLRVLLQEDVNFLLTNRIPRQLATRFMGWFSRLELGPATAVAIAVWRRFAPDLDLSEARERRFTSLHACFTRELRPGARPVDASPDVLVSPCDAIVGAAGRVDGTTAIQAKGLDYALEELLGDEALVRRFADGTFVTLRLTSSMYHRFHAPCDGRLSRVTFIHGDTWNVNPIALARVERLFCRNERAVLDVTCDDPSIQVALVPVAAILVAGIRLHALEHVLDARYRGPLTLPCDARFAKGDELGWFQHGSTILVFTSGPLELAPGLATGDRVRMGEALLVRTPRTPSGTAPVTSQGTS